MSESAGEGPSTVAETDADREEHAADHAPGPDPAQPSDGPDDAPARDNQKRIAAGAGGMVLVVAGVGIATQLAEALNAGLEEIGTVDRRTVVVQFCASVLGALVVAFGAGIGAKAALPEMSGFAQLLVAVLIALVVVGGSYWILVERPDSEFVIGELDESEPFTQRVLVSGGSGHRYLVTLESSGTLRAEMRLRGAGRSIDGVLQEDGSILLEGVLVGSTTWTATLKYLEGDGKYRIFVDSAEPEKLTPDDSELQRGYSSGASRQSYTFDLSDRDSVFIEVEPLAGALGPGLVLSDDNGTTYASAAEGTEKATIFTELPPGDYVLEVRGGASQSYSLVYNDADPDAPQTTAPTVPDEDVDVPDVARLPEAEAAAALTDAGFAVNSFAVCSSSLQGPENAGLTRQVVIGGTASDEVEVVGLEGVVVDRLPAGTPLDVKVSSGLPC